MKKEMLLYKINNYDVTIMSESKKQLNRFRGFLKLISDEVKIAINTLKKKGIMGNEKPIKEIIYDKWGRSRYDAEGMPLEKKKWLKN